MKILKESLVTDLKDANLKYSEMFNLISITYFSMDDNDIYATVGNENKTILTVKLNELNRLELSQSEFMKINSFYKSHLKNYNAYKKSCSDYNLLYNLFLDKVSSSYYYVKSPKQYAIKLIRNFASLYDNKELLANICYSIFRDMRVNISKGEINTLLGISEEDVEFKNDTVSDLAKRLGMDERGRVENDIKSLYSKHALSYGVGFKLNDEFINAPISLKRDIIDKTALDVKAVKIYKGDNDILLIFTPGFNFLIKKSSILGN